MIGHQQCGQDDQSDNQNDRCQLLVEENSQPYMAGSTGTVSGTNNVLSELVALQSTQLVLNYTSLLSAMIHDGGQIRSLSSRHLIIEIQGQTITIIFTNDVAFFTKHAHLSEYVQTPAHIARWREHLIALGIDSTSAMINDTPIVIAFGSVSVLFQTPFSNMLVCV